MNRIGSLSIEELGEIVEEIRSESEAEEADSITVLLKYFKNEFIVYYTVDLPLSFSEFKRRVSESTGIRSIGRIRYQQGNQYRVISSESDWDFYLKEISSFSNEPKLFVEEEEENFENYSIVKMLSGGNLAISEKDTPIFIRTLEISGRKEKIEKRIKRILRLRHPNIVRLFTYSIKNDQLCILMEYIPDTIIEGLKMNFTYSEQCIKSYLYSLLQALRFLHQAKVIPKDFSEKSIRVTEFGRLSISLFHLIEYEISPKDFKPTYISKETFDNCRVNNEKTNTFQIGCVAYSMLKGKQIEIPESYYSEKNGKDCLLEIVKKDKSINEPFLSFLECCLVKDIAKRSTIEELLDHELMESERMKTFLDYRNEGKELELSSDSEDEDEGEED